jgi:tRNA(Ile)-lysidine synthase
MRLAVGLSGGADSVALLRALAEQRRELGLVLHAAHLHHSLRGTEADEDLAFCRDLADRLDIPFHFAQVNTAAEAAPDPAINKSAESIEEAARRLRYAWFRQIMSKGLPHEAPLDAVATAHTLDDQAETVLAKLLRGAWTEGLSGIHPVLAFPEGRILRPLLAVPRNEIETYLQSLNQPWREDSSNRHLGFTRNRIRHELLPLLETWNPRLREHLAQMATLARDEEAWWQTEIARIAPQLILPGQPVRGGGRAATPALAFDITRLSALPPAHQRRLLRRAVDQLGTALDFVATETLRQLALSGRAGQKCEIANGILAERTHREIRLTPASARPSTNNANPLLEYTATLPGEIAAPSFGVRLRIFLSECQNPSALTARSACLRPWKPGDRVRVRHSSSSRKVKEVLERMKVTGTDRTSWPVLDIDGHIAWMRGIEVEPELGIEIQAEPLSSDPPSSHPL